MVGEGFTRTRLAMWCVRNADRIVESRFDHELLSTWKSDLRKFDFIINRESLKL